MSRIQNFEKMEEYIQTLTEKIAKYILEILQHNPALPMSWGLEDPKPVFIDSMPGLSFIVHGYKHEGPVNVLLNEGSDSFEIRLLGQDGSVKSETKDVFLQDLSSVVDELIEKTEDYEKRISEDYPFLSRMARSGNPISIVIL